MDSRELPDAFKLFSRQAAGCIVCTDIEPCACSSTQLCERTIQTCTQCAKNFCVANPALSKSTKGGVSTGALAGAAVGCILLVVLVGGGFFLWRRKQRAKQAAEIALEKSTISPFDLQGPNVINSPLATPGFANTVNPRSPTSPHPRSPNEVRVYRNSVINLDSNGQPIHEIHNPFNDAASTTTSGTNVIPIAYVPSSPASMSIADGMASPSFAPSRPVRSPELNLKLPAHAISRASMFNAVSSSAGNGDLLAPRSPYAAQSTRSGVSGVSSRASTISTGSSILYDRPQIVTSAKVGRQVLGVMRAEVVQVANNNSPPSSPRSGSTLRPRVSVKSPLAGPSISQADIHDIREESPPPLPSMNSPTLSARSDPFEDSNSSSLSAAGYPLPNSHPPTPTTPAYRNEVATEARFRLSEGRNLTGDIQAPQRPFNNQFPRESVSSFISATSRADSIINNAFVFMPPTPSPMNSPTPDDISIRRGFGNEPSRRTLGMSTASSANGLDGFQFSFNQDEMPLPQMNLPENSGARASLDTLALSRDVAAHPLGFDREHR